LSGYFVLDVFLLVHAVTALLDWMSHIVSGHSVLGVGDRVRGYIASALLHFTCSAESLSYSVLHSGSVSLIQASIESQSLMILILIITNLSLLHGSTASQARYTVLPFIHHRLLNESLSISYFFDTIQIYRADLESHCVTIGLV
jgi:hypothetical protein